MLSTVMLTILVSRLPDTNLISFHSMRETSPMDIKGLSF